MRALASYMTATLAAGCGSMLCAAAAPAATVTEIPVQQTGLSGPNRLAFAADGSAWTTFGTLDPDSTRLLRLHAGTGRVLGKVDGLPGIPVDLATGADGLMYATSKSPPWGDVSMPSHVTAFRPDGAVAGTLTERRILSGVAAATGGGAWVGSYEVYVTGRTSGDQAVSRWAPGQPAMTDVVTLPAPSPGHSIGAHRIQTLEDGTTWFLEHNFPSGRPVGPGGTLAGDERLGRIDPEGNVELRPLVQDAFVDDFAVARDGSVWFVVRRNTAPGEAAQTLARYDPATASLREQPMPVDGFSPRLASVPDGDVWMALGSAVVRIDPTTSATTVVPLPTGSLAESPIAGDIVPGPGGTLWITDANGALVRVDPSDSGTAIGALATAARDGVNALVRCRRACRAVASVTATVPRARGAHARTSVSRARRVRLGQRRVRLEQRGALVTRVKTERRRRGLLRGRPSVDVTIKVRVREGGRLRTKRTHVLLRR